MATSVIRLTTAQPATIDRIRSGEAAVAVQIVAVVGFALLTALGAQVRIYLWEIPFSLQTLVVYGSGLFLGWRNGMLAQLLYLSLGLFQPVFAGDGFGLSYFFVAASAGYLISYPIAAAVIGLLSARWNSLAGSTISGLVGGVIIFSMGVTWLHFFAGHSTWMESLERGFFPFALFDLIKIALAGGLYAGLRRL